MTFATVSERVEKRRTSPVDGAEDGGVGCCVADAWARAGEGTGEGYARYELSAEGERATMATERGHTDSPSRNGTHHLGLE